MKYDEVMVDEYQDSNLVQEMITTCVSGWAKKSKNIFMVGDVKQSIYRFRLARPELFMEKYKKYMLTDSEEQRIDLHKNSEADPRCFPVPILFSGRSWARIWVESRMMRQLPFILALFFQKEPETNFFQRKCCLWKKTQRNWKI